MLDDDNDEDYGVDDGSGDDDFDEYNQILKIIKMTTMTTTIM
jgi:hypothetical protein